MEPTPEQTAFMAKNWRDLIRPRTLEIEERSETYGKFSCEPLERGFGTTLGVALRRILLSSLQGAAITHIAIEGALHEFTSLPGVVEDVTDIILNLKETLFKVEHDKTYVVRLDKQGDGVVTAGDIALVDGVAGERGALGLYSLYPEGAAGVAEHVRRGSLPWWTVEEFRFVQVRPLSSLLLWVDHAVWPKDGVVHHLHSLGWLAAALLAAYGLLRRVTTPVIAGVSLLVYAVDETFGWTTAWLANRCAMVAAAFSFGALAVHLRRASGGEQSGTRDAWLEGALWGLAFAAGEYALCGMAYALAYALVGRSDGAWRVRARALVPVGVAFVGFATASAVLFDRSRKFEIPRGELPERI